MLLFICTNLKNFSTYLEVEDKGQGLGLGQESVADGFYSRIQISTPRYLLNLMFRIALHRIFKQETISLKSRNNAYMHHNTKIKNSCLQQNQNEKCVRCTAS
jgi:hypothetical protein